MGNKTLFQTVNDLSSYIYEWIKNRGFRFYPEEEVEAEKNNLFTTVLPIGAYSVSNISRPDNIKEQYYYPIPHGTLEEQKTYNGTLFSMQFGDKPLQLFIQSNGIIALRKYGNDNKFGPWFDLNDYYTPPVNSYDSSEWEIGISRALRQIGVGYTLEDNFDLNFSTPWSEEEDEENGSFGGESPVNLETGIYWLSSSRTYKNAPVGTDGGILIYLADFHSENLSNFRRYQIMIDSNTRMVFLRNYNRGYWSDWDSLNQATDLLLAELTASLNPIRKDNLLEIIGGNIFNNYFVPNYRISGPRTSGATNDDFDNIEKQNKGEYIFSSVREWHGVSIVPIEPNTSYWIGLDKLICEKQPDWENENNNKYYSYFAFATTTKILAIGDSFDGNIFRKKPDRPIVGHLITTGPNDKYLYIQTCRGAQAPYLEIVKVNLNNLPEQISNLTWYDYNFNDKCENDNGKYVLAKGVANSDIYTDEAYHLGLDLSGYNITNIGDYGKVKYALTDVVDLNNGLTVKVKPSGNNLFDGNFIDISKGYRINGSAISSMTKDDLSAYFALISVEPGKKYHLYVSPYGKETTKTGGVAQYLKLGISNYSKEELTAILNKNSETTIPLGHLYQGTVTTDYIFTIDSNGYYSRFQKEDADGKSYFENGDTVIEAKTLVLQISVENNLPFVLLEEDNSSFETSDNGASQYSVATQVSSATKQKIYIGKALNNSYASHPGAEDNKIILNTYGDVEVVYGRNKYILKHQWDADKGVRTWRWYEHLIDNGVLVSDGDCEGPIKIVRLNTDGTITQPKDYIGGYHGNEQLTQIKFFIDGKPIDLTKAAIYRNCKDVKMNIVSNCYWSQSERLYLEEGCKWELNNSSKIIIKDDNDNIIDSDGFGFNTEVSSLSENYQSYFSDFNLIKDTKKYIVDVGQKNNKYFLVLNYKNKDLLFKRTKQLTFTPEKLNIRNYWKYVGNDGEHGLLQSFHTGLYSVLFKYLNGIYSNYTNTIYDVPDGASSINQTLDNSANTTEVTFLGKSFTSSIKALRGCGPYYKGSIKNMDTETTSGVGDERYKAYLSDGPWSLDADKLITLGIPSKEHPEYKNEIIGEFEIITTAPNGFKLHEDGTVEEVQ